MRCFSTLALAAALLVFAGSRSRADDPKPPQSPPPTTTPADQAGPTKFYGTISAIDLKAMTFTVDNQVFRVVAETHLTKAADDSAATLSDAVVGEPARGTYTKASDGTLNVTKVRFGKKAGGGKGNGSGKKKDKEPTTQPK